MKPETKLKDKVLRELRLLPDSWWVKTQQVAIRGTPDILGVLRSRFIALELKSTEKEKADPLQLFNLEQIEKAGGYATILNPENEREILEELWKLSWGRKL